MENLNSHLIPRFILLALIMVSCVSCAGHFHASPETLLKGEVPAVVEKGHISGRVFITNSGWKSEKMRWNDLSIALGGVTGLGRNFDIGGAINGTAQSGPIRDSGIVRVVGGGVRLKWNPDFLNVMAVSAGSVFDINPLYASYSLEGTVIFGYKTRYFTPYLNLKGIHSRPFSGTSKHLKSTSGFEGLSGLQVPLGTTGFSIGVDAGRTILFGENREFSSYLFGVRFEKDLSLKDLTAPKSPYHD